jgi:DNA-binding transcriptional MerR regulator
MSEAATPTIAMNQTKAARAVGVTSQTIRNWEKRGLISGRRAANGVKLYAVEDLQKLAGK